MNVPQRRDSNGRRRSSAGSNEAGQPRGNGPEEVEGAEGQEAEAEEEEEPPKSTEEVAKEAKDAALEAASAAREAAERAVTAAELAARTAVEDQAAAVQEAKEAAEAAAAALEEARQAATAMTDLADEVSLEEAGTAGQEEAEAGEAPAADAPVASADGSRPKTPAGSVPGSRPKTPPEPQPEDSEDEEAARAAAAKLEELKKLTGELAEEAQAAFNTAAIQQERAQAAAEEAEEIQVAAIQKANYWVQAHSYMKEEQPKSAVVFLHGQGEIEASWAEILPPAVEAPNAAAPCRWIWPRADFSPCTSRGGAMTLQWFDTPEFPVCDVVRGVPDRQRLDEDSKQIAAAVRVVHAAIAALEAEGISSRRIVVGGFGQGAALAAHAVLRYERPLAGGVLLSAWVPCLEALSQTVTAAGSCAELLWVHGVRDAMVWPRVAVKQMRALEELGATVEFRMLPELGFGVNEEVLAYFNTWLGKKLLAGVEAEDEPAEEGTHNAEGEPAQPTEAEQVPAEEAPAPSPTKSRFLAVPEAPPEPREPAPPAG